MDAISMLFKRGCYNSYSKKPELFEPIFPLFLSEPDNSDVMREVSARSHIQLTTLSDSWREKYAQNRAGDPPKDISLSLHKHFLPMLKKASPTLSASISSLSDAHRPVQFENR
jgi:hypothetical protein